jgi:hypothetical protein
MKTTNRVLDNSRTDCECAGRTGGSLADGAFFGEPQWSKRGASNQ